MDYVLQKDFDRWQSKITRQETIETFPLIKETGSTVIINVNIFFCSNINQAISTVNGDRST